MTACLSFALFAAGLFAPSQVFTVPKHRVLASAALFAASAGLTYGIWAAFFVIGVTAWGALEMTRGTSGTDTKGTEP